MPMQNILEVFMQTLVAKLRGIYTLDFHFIFDLLGLFLPHYELTNIMVLFTFYFVLLFLLYVFLVIHCCFQEVIVALALL